MPTLSTYLPALQRVWPWLLRAGSLLFLLSLIAAPAARAVMGTPQTVETTLPQLCVHTRLIDDVYDWKLLHSLELVREMGAATIVEFFPWAYLEPERNQYQWQRADLILGYARNQGLNVIARLGLVPDWARTEIVPSTLNTLPPTAYADFARFAAAFAARYAGTVQEIIVWNEPNLAFEWGYAATTPADYAELVRQVYTAVKAISPTTQVLAGALAPTLEPVGSPNGMNDLLYLQALYEDGLQPYFDGLAVHAYGLTRPADDPPAPDILNFRRVELLREIMVQNGDAAKPVFITESGWNDHPRWAFAVRPAQRVQATLEALHRVEAEWPWARTLCLWVFRTPAPANSYPDGFTLVSTNFELRPLYLAVQAVARNNQTAPVTWLPAPASSR